MRRHEETTAPATKKKQESNCTCDEPPKAKTCCCRTECFVRPNYFCGHLLTDADLSLGQKYAIEKQKLYHRSLHGSGVVCGLRLSCDHECDGYVRVSDGFAIDDCGNDLVVCEPARVNVLGELRKRGLILDRPEDDPCYDEDEEKQEECDPKQCFYIAACYEEQPGDFTTPFRSGCSGGPSECEPTRVHEKVRFEILEELPHRTSALERLRDRVRRCYSIFSEGALGRKLTEHRELLLRFYGVIPQPGGGGTATAPVTPDAKATFDNGGPATTNNDDGRALCDALCEIRVLFLHYLRQHPDQYNCGTERLVRDIHCPEPNSAAFAEEMKRALDALFERMMRYAWDCVLNELAFPCDEPCCASCVVLGTVEVERGRIVRVCNIPREYVWSPAHFLPVLFFTSMTAKYNAFTPFGGQRNEDDDGDDHGDGCCPEPPFDALSFFKFQRVSSRHAQYVGTAPFDAVGAFMRSLFRFSDFTDQTLVSAQIVREKPVAEWNEASEQAGFFATRVNRAARTEFTPFKAFEDALAMQAGSPMVMYEGGELSADFLRGANRDQRSTQELETLTDTGVVEQFRTQVQTVSQKVDQVGSETERMRAQMTEMRRELDALRQQNPVVDTKPVDTTPVDVKPVEPVVDTRPVDVVVDTKPVDVAPVDTRPPDAPDETPRSTASRTRKRGKKEDR